MRKIYLLGYDPPCPVRVDWVMDPDYQSAQATMVLKRGERREKGDKSTVFLCDCGCECERDDVMVLLRYRTGTL